MMVLPLELWMLVFDILLESPTLPEHSEDVVLARALLAQRCDSMEKYASARKQSALIRQVSKTWRSIIDRRTLAESLWGSYVEPTATRMDFKDRHCYDEYECPLCNVQRISPIDFVVIEPDQVRAWIDPQDCSGLPMVHVLATFTCLTSLSVCWTSLYSLSQLSLDAPGLNYLLISDYEMLLHDWSVSDAHSRSILNLPLLVSLSISGLDNQHQIPFGRWVLPRLTDLVLAISESPLVEVATDPIFALLRGVGPHLRGLSYIRTADLDEVTDGSVEGYVIIAPDIWDICPQLTTLALTEGSFRHCPPPPSDYPVRLEVVLLGFECPVSNDHIDDGSGVVLTDQIAAWSPKIAHFRIGISWDRFFIDLFMDKIESRAYRHVVTSVHSHDLVVYDLHHTSSHEYVARWLELAEVDNKRAFYQYFYEDVGSD